MSYISDDWGWDDVGGLIKLFTAKGVLGSFS